MRYGMMTVFLIIMLEQALVQNVFIKRIFNSLTHVRKSQVYQTK